MRFGVSFATAARRLAFHFRTAGNRYQAALLGFLSLGMVAAAPPTSSLLPPEIAPLTANVNFDFENSLVAESRQPLLASSTLTLDLSTDLSGRLTAVPAGSREPLLENASASLVLKDGTTIDLAKQGRQIGAPSMRAVNEPGLGAGTKMETSIWVPAMDMAIRSELTLFERGPYFTYRLIIPHGNDKIAGFSYLGGTILPGERPGRVTLLGDDDKVVEKRIAGGETTVRVGPGKPVLVNSAATGRSLLMALLDPTDPASILTASPGAKGINFRWDHPYVPGEDGAEVKLPRLLVRSEKTSGVREAFAPYRELMNTLYPPAPLPGWFRQQWISWYLYGMEIDETKIKSQIDYIAANLSDVGPWSILVDAGWYVAEGRPGGDWRNVDSDKFPNGLRSLVDYAHERGVKVVLYFSASYLDDREAEGNWLGLRKVIDENPDWLVPIENGETWRSYYYDFNHPGFQEYMRQVLRDYFVTYDVDGIKVDGLMDTRLAVERAEEQGLYDWSSLPTYPTSSIYAFVYGEAQALKPDVYLEAGWSMPGYSASHFTVARQADDRPDFASEYPQAGLGSHVDYAIAQQLLLGQRPHVGNVWGDPNENPIGLQWLEAGLALNAPVVLGFDLNEMTSEALSEYRARLTMLRPFEGRVHLPERLEPDSFSATSDGTTFIALINRAESAREISTPLRDHGLFEGRWLAGYDVEAGRPLPVGPSVGARVEGETVRLFAVRSQPGVLWTNSGFMLQSSSRKLSLSMSGPADLPGFAYVAVPKPREVLVDGRSLSSSEWSYDEQAGVARIEYSHWPDRAVVVEIAY